MDINRSMKKTIALGIAFVFILGIAPMSASDADSADYEVLIDYGNGRVIWTEQVGTGDVGEIMTASLDAIGVAVSFAPVISVDGLSEKTIGSATGIGTYSVPGTTGVQSTASWKAWSWDSENSDWVSALPSDAVENKHLAISFGTSTYKPTVTPDHPYAHVMFASDSSLSNTQTSGGQTASTEAEFIWKEMGSCYASMTYVQNRLFVKYGVDAGSSNMAKVVCYDYTDNFSEVWTFEYPGMENYETGAPLICGDSIYVPAAYGYVFRFDWRAGPGDGNADVIMTDGDTGASLPYSEEDVRNGIHGIPSETAALTGMTYEAGCTSIIGDSGVLYFNNSNGMTYCLDEDLKLIWSFQSGGSIYFTVPSICDDYLFTGAMDGSLHVLDKATGAQIAGTIVFQKEYAEEGMFGSVCNIAVIQKDGMYHLFMSVNDGRGMNITTAGYAHYAFDGTSLEKIGLVMDRFGLVINTFTPNRTPGEECVYMASSNGIFKADPDGTYSLFCRELDSIKAPLSMVDGSHLLIAPYDQGSSLYRLGMDGRIISYLPANYNVYNYCMTPPLVIGDLTIAGNDSGSYAARGAFTEYVYPDPEPSSGGSNTVLYVSIGVVAGALVLSYSYLRFAKGVSNPFGLIFGKAGRYLNGEGLSHNAKSRRRLLVMMIIGVVLSIIMFIASICIGPTRVMSPIEAVSALFSSISKGGRGLDYDEIMVYSSRLPRTIVAFIVGIGLSIAGVMYQAIIRNPLVDPYIMGVSSGAGTAAIAVIGFDFTFFGLFSSHSIFLTAAVAMIGGVLAFLATMILAEKSGGTAINYVLAGVVIGLVFSAAQSIMLTTASENVTSALSWLFGSFANISWSQVSIVFFPVLGISLASLIWAKEFNLVLLGEDQAKQMGLNVARFNRLMLILASVLTSLCVAFCGIIGFVGLVVPHLCRMVLGGDHRLVMPCSIVFGGFLLMFADLMSRVLWNGVELPVGAITTLIGIPVFAWLLIKRGKMYDG